MHSYRERLTVPVGWWLLASACVALLGTEVWAGLGGLIPAGTYVVLAAVVGAVLVNWSAAVIEVTGDTLRAGRATLPLDQVGEVVALDEAQATRLRGPRADPAAHLLLRPYLKRAVYIELAGPDSDVPYWLLATRKPTELAAAIQRSHQVVR
ncbi:MAG: DUF3093 domain-containing protein [Nocardiopsaceae bacterium]|nr:DUF3093 domain-containing protein [Nocardiopsaceae bacterium]